MKKAYVSLFIVLTINMFSFSQTGMFSGKGAMTTIVLPPGNYKIGDVKPKDIEGSQFMNEEWKIGVLKTDSVLIEDLKYRYNIYGKQMQYMYDSVIYSIGAPHKIKSLNFDNKCFIYSIFNNNGIEEYDFFQVLVEGKCKLLIRREIQIIQANYNYTHNVGSHNDKFVLVESYYMKKGDAPAVKVKKFKKRFLQNFEDKNIQVADYMKKQKISLGKQDDLMKVVDYYNTL